MAKRKRSTSKASKASSEGSDGSDNDNNSDSDSNHNSDHNSVVAALDRLEDSRGDADGTNEDIRTRMEEDLMEAQPLPQTKRYVHWITGKGIKAKLELEET